MRRWIQIPQLLGLRAQKGRKRHVGGRVPLQVHEVAGNLLGANHVLPVGKQLPVGHEVAVGIARGHEAAQQLLPLVIHDFRFGNALGIGAHRPVAVIQRHLFGRHDHHSGQIVLIADIGIFDILVAFRFLLLIGQIVQQVFSDGGAHHIVAVLVQMAIDRGAAHENARVKGRHVPGARVSGRVAVADGVGGLVRAHIHPEVQLLKRGVSVGLEAGLHRFAAAGDMRAGDVRHHDVAGDPLVHVGKSGVIRQHLAHDLRHVQEGARACTAADAGHDHHIHAHRCASCTADFHRGQTGELGFERIVYAAVVAA